MEVDAAELTKLRSVLREHPTCILFTHKTYIDGATPSSLAYENDLPMLHSFGGANLDFAVMGQFFRRSGMIFIRRSFQDQPVYKLRADERGVGKEGVSTFRSRWLPDY